MIAMLVKKRTVDELVERIRHGKVISKERVLHESGWPYAGCLSMTNHS